VIVENILGNIFFGLVIGPTAPNQDGTRGPFPASEKHGSRKLERPCVVYRVSGGVTVDEGRLHKVSH
jgi:hypothetical protein